MRRAAKQRASALHAARACSQEQHSKPLGNHAFPLLTLYFLCALPAAVKSSNVLLSARGAAKLGDVGLSRLLERTHLSAVSCIGTFAW